VRPLYDDGASKAKDATRDYVLAADMPYGEAPLLTVYGGKITTYRRLAEAALAHFRGLLPGLRRWTHTVPLPGGDFAVDGIAARVAQARRQWPFLNDAQALRLVRAYGTRLERVLAGVGAQAPAGFGSGLSEAEVRYLMRQEWASEPADVLWRRSKRGLHMDGEGKAALARFMAGEAVRRAAE
jgi:glycerol-3-phosphate dehydrogenase